MGEPYVGEIRMFGGNFPPVGWMLCQGQSLPISENEVLFQLIGTTYGGDGQETFNLPDLQGRAPVHMGQGPGISQAYQIGEEAGVESVTLTTQQIPIHNHAFIASLDAPLGTDPTNQMIAQSSQIHLFTEDVTNRQMNALALTPAGGSQPHENMQPYLCISFIISLFGVFPSQS
ncbi:MAG TPA: tail fiber protein [Pyrinomonadaceae bacterium]|nr:tail fiber protein [Pyrinomonadaceae bacterium]